MPEPVTVPADLLPGLCRPRVPVLRVLRDQPLELAGGVNVFMFEYDDAPGFCLLADEQGIYPDTPIAELVLVLSEPDGWDAAVAALARKLRPTMADHQRASFFWMGGWCLSDPPGGKGGAMYFDVGMGADQPAEALRRVLRYVAERLA